MESKVTLTPKPYPGKLSVMERIINVVETSDFQFL